MYRPIDNNNQALDEKLFEAMQEWCDDEEEYGNCIMVGGGSQPSSQHARRKDSGNNDDEDDYEDEDEDDEEALKLSDIEDYQMMDDTNNGNSTGALGFI